MRTLENALRRYGFHRIAGVDEVGRGCLAGPVVAAAVVLDPERYIPGIHDSKMVSALERERLYGVITRKALAWSVASAQPAEIDDINIHRASLEAMRRAVMTLAPLPDLVLVDAFRIPELLIAQRGVALEDKLNRYERYIYKQWLRVYMQSKMIKNNKDLFQSLDDPVALLGKLHIY